MVEVIDELEVIRDEVAEMYESLAYCQELRFSEYATRSHTRRLYAIFNKLNFIVDKLSQK